MASFVPTPVCIASLNTFTNACQCPMRCLSSVSSAARALPSSRRLRARGPAPLRGLSVANVSRIANALPGGAATTHVRLAARGRHGEPERRRVGRQAQVGERDRELHRSSARAARRPSRRRRGRTPAPSPATPRATYRGVRACPAAGTRNPSAVGERHRCLRGRRTPARPHGNPNASVTSTAIHNRPARRGEAHRGLRLGLGLRVGDGRRRFARHLHGPRPPGLRQRPVEHEPLDARHREGRGRRGRGGRGTGAGAGAGASSARAEWKANPGRARTATTAARTDERMEPPGPPDEGGGPV